MTTLRTLWCVVPVLLVPVLGSCTRQEAQDAQTPRPSPAAAAMPANTVSGSRAVDPPPRAPRPAPEAELSQERLLAHIRALPTARAGWGNQAHRDGLRRTENWLAGELRSLGYSPVVEPIDQQPDENAAAGAGDTGDGAASTASWNNIYIDIRGTTHADEWIIFGAHFDAVVNSPGADDNGTGVATLLEMARVLKGRPLRRSVRLVFFNLEEMGLIGSRAHALRLQPAVESGSMKIAGMVSMDMLGYYSDKPNSQKSPLPPSRVLSVPTVADFIGIGGILQHRTFSQALVRAMNEAEPAMKVVAADFLPVAPPDLLRSDHAPFLALGVPAVIVSDTANFRSPHYHRPTDTIETIDVEMFTRCARALTGALYRLAGDPEKAVVDLAAPEIQEEVGAQ